VLRLSGSSTLTLTGNVYSLCHLKLENNAQLIIGARDPTVPLKIYIDAPENCPGVVNGGSVWLEHDSTIVNVNSDPTTLQLYPIGQKAETPDGSIYRYVLMGGVTGVANKLYQGAATAVANWTTQQHTVDLAVGDTEISFFDGGTPFTVAYRPLRSHRHSEHGCLNEKGVERPFTHSQAHPLLSLH